MLQKRPSRRLFIVWMIYAVLVALLLSAASVAMTYIRPLPQIYVYLFSAVWVAVWLFVVCVFLPLRFRHIAYALHEDRLEVTDGVLTKLFGHAPALYEPPCTQFLTKKGDVVNAPLIKAPGKDRGPRCK